MKKIKTKNKHRKKQRKRKFTLKVILKKILIKIVRFFIQEHPELIYMIVKDILEAL